MTKLVLVWVKVKVLVLVKVMVRVRVEVCACTSDISHGPTSTMESTIEYQKSSGISFLLFGMRGFTVRIFTR